MLSDLASAAAIRGLELHPDKTKILSNLQHRHGEGKKKHADVGGMKVEILTLEASTKYLGRDVSLKDPHSIELENRIRCAWRKFHANKNVLCNKAHDLGKRLKLFDSIITPTVMYGAGCWVTTKEAESRLSKTQRRMLRSMCQYGRKVVRAEPSPAQADESDSSKSHSSHEILSDIENEELEPWHEWVQRVTHAVESKMEKVGVANWIQTQRSKFFRWAGHVARYSDERWTIRILNWTPNSGQGRRPRARPWKRWSDSLGDFVKARLGTREWQVVAQDRERWSRLDKEF